VKALITGASAGIGKAYAHQLARAGYDLVLTARRETRLNEIRDSLQARHSVTVEVLPADLTSDDDLARLENYLADNGVNMLINNAGFGTDGKFIEVDVGRHLDMIDVHLKATIRLTYAALPNMIKQRSGTIINVSSIAAFMTRGGSPNYSSTKAYLNVFSKNLQGEMRDFGIKVQALCPGFTYTEFHDTSDHHTFKRSDIPDILWMSADEVVTASLLALKSNRVVVVPGYQNRLITTFGGTKILGIARNVLRL